MIILTGMSGRNSEMTVLRITDRYGYTDPHIGMFDP